MESSAPAVVSREEWLRARIELLAEEKRFTRDRDALSAKRRALPRVRVEQEYVFAAPGGPESLSDLFSGRSQLVVYHFMFRPEWDEGCPHCSFWADSFDPNVVHLAARDVTMIAVSRAPLEKLEAYRRRMGWSFHWVSSEGNSFNQDFGVTIPPEHVADGSARYNFAPYDQTIYEREGMSVFARDESGEIFHTYSAYARGIDLLNTAYNYLDLVPKGRDEEGRPPQFWVRRHDEYAG
jgi:predicted dithiol-disulfide oxidoreductase (DUF899 family)